MLTESKRGKMRRKKGVSNLEIKEHILLPKHMKVSEKEKQEILAKYNITLKELPKIYQNDHGTRSLKLQPGDIVKIMRKSQTAGESAYYRVVTNE